jgi:flotillin
MSNHNSHPNNQQKIVVPQHRKGYNLTPKEQLLGFVGLTLAGSVVFALTRYRTSLSNQWLVRTGMGINDIQIGKRFFQWPFQNIQTIDLSPESFKFVISAMSKEKMQLDFPAVFTIGPDNKEEHLKNYSRFLLNQMKEDKSVLIRSVIEGEARAIAANLSIEEIFAGRGVYKMDIVNNVQQQLDHYGLKIFNANVEELRDADGSVYFKALAQKIQSEAENRAKVEVAEQNKIGNIGAKLREGVTRQEIARIESETKLIENERLQQVLTSNAQLEKLKQEQELIMKNAKIESEGKSQILNQQYETEIQQRRLEAETQKKRAEELSIVRVQAEMTIRQAEAEAESKKIIANANLFSKEMEAKGILAVYQAQAEGAKNLVQSFNSDTQSLNKYLMIEKGTYEKLFQSSADSIKGLNPNITIWSKDSNEAFSSISDLAKTMVPLMDTIEKQTGYVPPEWLLKKKETKIINSLEETSKH